MKKTEIMMTNGVYLNDSEGYEFAKAKYSELVRLVGVTNVKFEDKNGKIKVTKE